MSILGVIAGWLEHGEMTKKQYRRNKERQEKRIWLERFREIDKNSTGTVQWVRGGFLAQTRKPLCLCRKNRL